MGFDGLLVIDKPAGMTSRDAVNRAQRWFPRRTKIGHTGTLDPLATGVLVLCVGSATRLADYVQRMGKTYTSTFLLGATSDTDDIDGTVTAVPPPGSARGPGDRTGAAVPTPARVAECLAGFVGEIDQTPPRFSAAKIGGKRAYDLARAGAEVTVAPRRVRIDAIDVIEYAFPYLKVEVRCGKGTYIRSIARDLGERLGCGGLVAELRRTSVGPFAAEDGLSPEAGEAEARAKLLPPSAAADGMPRVRADERGANSLLSGRVWRPPGRLPEPGTDVAVFDEAGGLVGIAVVEPGSALRPERMLPRA